MRALRQLGGLGERIRLLAATPLLVLLAILDSVSWIISFCIDLALGAALIAVFTIGRKTD